MNAARRFAWLSAAVSTTLKAYQAAPSQGTADALKLALRDFFATARGREALLKAAQADAAFRNFLHAYDAGKGSTRVPYLTSNQAPDYRLLHSNPC
jgi:hypothetical protein